MLSGDSTLLSQESRSLTAANESPLLIGLFQLHGFHGSLLSEDLPLIHNRLEAGLDAIVESKALVFVDQGLAHIQHGL